MGHLLGRGGDTEVSRLSSWEDRLAQDGTSPGRARAVSGSDRDADTASEEGLRAAFLAHGRELVGFARRTLNDPSHAEDVVQETFARAWRSRARFDPSLGTMRTWLFAIERRVLLDVQSRRNRDAAERLDDEDMVLENDRVDEALLSLQITSALSALDAEHRLVITELYFNGRSGPEVAALFGIPEGTVRSRAYYALRSLRSHMDDNGWAR
jgi:RNA polymerase sigma-70 factor (ECF subfamily)